MITLLAAMCAWMAFYVFWQATRQRPPVLRILSSSLCAISVACLAYGIALHQFYGANAAPGIPAAISKQVRPSLLAGVALLLVTVALEIVIRRKKKDRRIDRS